MPKQRKLILGKPSFVRKDLTGKRFGLLVAQEVIGHIGANLAWKCICDCGKEKVSSSSKLLDGGCTHCGCKYVNGGTKHGLIKSPLYKVWEGMKIRCLYKNAISYPNYGGRGIKICDEWIDDFKCFHDDMISGYKNGLQLDRIDNDKGYYKENCKWSDRTTQSRNKRNNQWHEADGKKMILQDWANYLGINRARITEALNANIPFLDIYNHYKQNPPKYARIKRKV